MMWLAGVLAFFIVLLLIPVRVSAEYVYSIKKKQNIFKVKIFGISIFESGKAKSKKSECKAGENLSKDKFDFDEFKKILKKWDTGEEKIKKNS